MRVWVEKGKAERESNPDGEGMMMMTDGLEGCFRHAFCCERSSFLLMIVLRFLDANVFDTPLSQASSWGNFLNL